MRSVVRARAEANLYAAASWYQDQESGSSLWMDLLGVIEPEQIVVVTFLAMKLEQGSGTR